MILASRFVSDAKGEFKGGSSLSVNWGSLLRRAARKVLGNINPDTMKLRRAVYGGITKQQFAHFMDPDIKKPVALYKNDGDRKWTFLPPVAFAKDKDLSNKFTIAYTNGIPFLMVAHDEPGSTLVIDEMENVTGMTGTATPAVNSHDFLSGDAAVQAAFDSTGKTLIRTIDDGPLDLTDYLRGTVFIPVRISTASKLASLTLRLRTDGSNYYQVTTTADDIEDNIVNGWNVLRFDMANRSTTGTPTVTNIVDWMLTITADSGETVTCVIDRMTLQKTAPLWLEGYTDKMFVDSSGNLSTNCDPSSDSLNIDEEVADILHYELCLLVEQPADSSKDGASTSNFAAQLKRAYDNYYENHPSEQLPVSYNITPQMNRETPVSSSVLGDWSTYRDPNSE
jgi:hypothetical protein